MGAGASISEPSPRFGHFSAPIEGHICVSGGCTKGSTKEKGELVHTFHQLSESWSSKQCQGPSPPDGLYVGASAYAGHHLYLYGGTHGPRRQNYLHQLDTRSWTWSHLSSAGPMRKAGCGMVTYDETLLCFGGYGIPFDTTQPGAEFTKNSEYTDDVGWTNEVHAYDLRAGTWSSPPVSGTRPPPCAFFSLTKTDDHHLVLFGGIQGGVKTNDVYVLDLTRMDWSKLNIPPGDPCPIGRAGHRAVCLGYGRDHPQLLVTGGLGADKVQSDVWILDTHSGRWREVTVPNLQSRCWHSATAFNLSPGLTEVTLFGGFSEWPSNYKSDADFTPIANTTVLRFEYQHYPSTGGPITKMWVLTNTADSTQLGTTERVRQKRELVNQEEAQWMVERGEIQLTGPELGRGGWATVSVATFRGARVAAKCMHNQIVSYNNIQLFKREMNMASRIRHPNLLTFIGATLEGEMVILTELMPTSLRKELETQPMSPDQTIMISLDVARALNYLHLMRPHPLIHRDISSANVLLESLSNNRWRAKVSDYGTVNLLQQLHTVCPGNPSYAAPEANDPNQQSPKMDIFSFGALLIEMLTGVIPAGDARERLLHRIHHQPLLSLIQRCLRVRKEDRPNASDVITEIEPLLST